MDKTPTTELYSYFLKRMSEYFTIKDTPTVLPEWLYDSAKAEGIDMTRYVRRTPVPRQ